MSCMTIVRTRYKKSKDHKWKLLQTNLRVIFEQPQEWKHRPIFEERCLCVLMWSKSASWPNKVYNFKSSINIITSGLRGGNERLFLAKTFPLYEARAQWISWLQKLQLHGDGTTGTWARSITIREKRKDEEKTMEDLAIERSSRVQGAS